MVERFKRVATYGEPIFTGPGPGPLWRHHCGHLAVVDLLGDGDSKLQPWAYGCGTCGCLDKDWQPLFAYTGALCDQCDGNGWVPIGGKVLNAPMGYRTITECTACDASGMAS